jgi:selenocysteine-specific elongation factor
MPQSAEHLAVLDALGISAGAVALTKSDLIDEDRLAVVTETVRSKLAGSTLENAAIIECSARTGAGIDELVGELDRLVTASPQVPDEERPRLWIDRVFTVAGAGTVVTGTLTGGSLALGEAVQISPGGKVARVRGIESHNLQLDVAMPGNRIALNLVGLDKKDAARGDAIVRTGQWVETDRIDVVLRMAPQGARGDAREVTERGAHLLFVGSAETAVRITSFGGPHETTTYARLTLERPLPLGRGDRFVLRDAGRAATWGGGTIIDPRPPRASSKDPHRLALLTELDGASPSTAATALVESSGEMDLDELRYRSGARGVPADLRTLGPIVVSRSRWDELVTSLTEAVAAHHEERPLDKGIERETLRTKVGLSPVVFDAALAALAELVEEGPLVRLAGHRVTLTPAQEQERERIVTALSNDPFAPPLPNVLNVDPALVRVLVGGGELVEIGDFLLTRAAAEEAVRLVRDGIKRLGPLTVAQVRDLLSTTRKYAVPLCEWLDRTGATQRVDDTRTLGPMKEVG